MTSQIDAVRAEVAAAPLASAADLEAYRLRFLVRKSPIADLFSALGTLPPAERAGVGKLLNDLRTFAQERFDTAQSVVGTTAAAAAKATDDLTLPPPVPALGSLHPITLMLEEIKQVFFRLGFSVADGPELEDDFHNFTALNFPPEHPARDMQDTFFVRKDTSDPSKDLLLRTHTSPTQIRHMLDRKPPIRAIMPGRVYRNEAVNYKSYFLFHQVEALYVDKNVSFAELKETLVMLVEMVFNRTITYRMRPSFFPFTEPSLEMDIWWDAPGQPGRWMEILGAGMVHPNVLAAAGIDPDEYSGFALGLGVERFAKQRYGIDDIRLFYENDIRFLEQFR